MSTAFNRASVGHSMRLFSAPQPQRLRASWEAFEILCDAESDRIGDAELLMHATKEGLNAQI
ncbi:MAG: hypothetical protein ACXVH0_09095, partial [Thermoanaerobaculia bacterium]